MSRVYFGLSGSDANETNIKLIWYYNNILGRPEKKKIISRWRGYHGSGVMTGSAHRPRTLPQSVRPAARADPAHRSALLFPPPRPLDERGAVLAALRRQARRDDPGRRPGHDRRLHRRADPRHRRHRAAAGGYWQKIQAVLEKYDILLVADEVVTGFGRLGTMFGSDHYGIKPDLITIAKGLTSAYAPLSGSIVSDKMWQVLVQGSDKVGAIGHGWTYSAHPICAAAGVANLELVDELGSRRQCRLDRRLFPRRTGESGRRPQECRRRARRRADGGGRIRRGQGRPQVLRRVEEDRPAGLCRPSRARRHRPRHAAGRYPRLCAAALPDPRGSRHRREGSGGRSNPSRNI
jgi:hypothetical protein